MNGTTILALICMLINVACMVINIIIYKRDQQNWEQPRLPRALPCAYCGSHAITVNREDPDKPSVYCQCGMHVTAIPGASTVECVQAWNQGQGIATLVYKDLQREPVGPHDAALEGATQ